MVPIPVKQHFVPAVMELSELSNRDPWALNSRHASGVNIWETA
jgi:hypothetical protein